MENLRNTYLSFQKKIKEKETFIAGMVHDIRNPLSSIIGALEYLRQSEELRN